MKIFFKAVLILCLSALGVSAFATDLFTIAEIDDDYIEIAGLPEEFPFAPGDILDVYERYDEENDVYTGFIDSVRVVVVDDEFRFIPIWPGARHYFAVGYYLVPSTRRFDVNDEQLAAISFGDGGSLDGIQIGAALGFAQSTSTDELTSAQMAAGENDEVNGSGVGVLLSTFAQFQSFEGGVLVDGTFTSTDYDIGVYGVFGYRISVDLGVPIYASAGIGVGYGAGDRSESGLRVVGYARGGFLPQNLPVGFEAYAMAKFGDNARNSNSSTLGNLYTTFGVGVFYMLD